MIETEHAYCRHLEMWNYRKPQRKQQNYSQLPYSGNPLLINLFYSLLTQSLQ